jgi:hypothetical protein
MRRSCRIAVAATTALTLWLGGQGALAQKSGGILKMPDFASPASMSIHEEVTRACRDLLAAAREGSQPCRQQRLQQLALRGCVARPRRARPIGGTPTADDIFGARFRYRGWEPQGTR